MFSSFRGEKVTVIVASRGDQILEYVGVLDKETDETIELVYANISYLMLSFQKGVFGKDMNKYKEGLERVIINKRHIISCDK